MIDLDIVLVTGLALGAAYGLVGVAVSAVAISTRTLHLAVGHVLVAGVLLRLVTGTGLLAGTPAWLSLPVALAAGAGASALLVPLVLAPLRRGLPWLVGLAVAGTAVEAAAGRWLGTATVRPEPLLRGEAIEVGGLAVAWPLTVALVIGIPAAGLLAAALRWTGWGRRLRLVGGSQGAAVQGGISPAAVRAGALAASGAAAVLAGLLIAPVTFIGVGQGAGFTVRGVAAAALVTRGALAPLPAGLALGLAEAAAQAAWPQAGGEVAVAVVVVAVLVARGSGEVVRAW